MKLLRRNNDKGSKKGNLSRNAEMKHRRAISLIEEFEQRTRGGADNEHSSEEMKGLNPKRLLCFNNKVKRDEYEEYGEENLKKSSWRSQNLGDESVKYSRDRNIATKNGRRNTGEVSHLCNELCQDYYEIRKHLKNRPVLTTKRAQILKAIAGSTSTSSTTDAPIRKFKTDNNKSGNCLLDFRNENKKLHQRHRSLLDDKGFVNIEKNTSKKKKLKVRKSREIIPRTKKSNNQKPKNANISITNKSKSHGSNNLKSSKNGSSGMWDELYEITASESTEYTIPVSYVEQKPNRSDVQPDISMISTLSSSSYTTCDESAVILSPRGANDEADSQINPGETSNNNTMSLVCSAPAFAIHQERPRDSMNRNPATVIDTQNSMPSVLSNLNSLGIALSNLQISNPNSVGVATSNLGTIKEIDDYLSPSADSDSSGTSVSSSTNDSTSGTSYGGSYYSDSSSTNEGDDLSAVYTSNQWIKAMSKKSKHTNIGCNVASDDIWNSIMFDAGTNNIVKGQLCRTKDARDDD